MLRKLSVNEGCPLDETVTSVFRVHCADGVWLQSVCAHRSSCWMLLQKACVSNEVHVTKCPDVMDAGEGSRALYCSFPFSMT